MPTRYLLSLIALARQQSKSDPRPTNRLGLLARPEIFTNICHRHSFERVHIVEAKKRGWPLKIEWDAVADRIRALKPHLGRLVEDKDEEFADLAPHATSAAELEQDGELFDDDSILHKRPRKGSVFWRQTVRIIRRQGARRSVAIQGQIESFEKFQPG